MLFLWLCFHLSNLSSVSGGVHGVWIARGLVLWFEVVKKLDSLLLLASVFEVDSLCMACQGSLLPFCIVARAIQSQRVLV